MGATGLTAEQKEQVKTEALRLRSEGLPYYDIAEQLGISLGTAHNYVSEGMKDLADLRRRIGEDLIEADLVLMDKMLRSLQDGIKEGKTGAINTALNVLNQRAKLLGTYAPEKKEVNVKTLEQLVADSYSKALAPERN